MTQTEQTEQTLIDAPIDRLEHSIQLVRGLMPMLAEFDLKPIQTDISSDRRPVVWIANVPQCKALLTAGYPIGTPADDQLEVDIAGCTVRWNTPAWEV